MLSQHDFDVQEKAEKASALEARVASLLQKPLTVEEVRAALKKTIETYSET